ncbi:Serpentine receptor class alpha-33 [Caenorhabditis elegans]|uniref:Serpentine receptor class alpha-33 n=1 Tax=Caenorhabditis elegans TaxID=6239 RepID=SRA33_CAEEL|nr:Serpentine receptor class alpha-33 [Caenorhabditis elegans]Q10935.2 RecName: Full=Serpentine receptor class alpha-33; Short=Protein sra-33 [Caenorhabditis elegans]CCD61738.1 Serpentine receptor class alpha-33 [Caenorhabditis elegans]|eukprot:NP_494802.3 Serpentine receptor class alpha-33 [Caenorhabditis elegans]
MNIISDKEILEVRTSQVFRFSVYFIDTSCIISMAVTVLAIFQLHSKQVFNPSTTRLLITDLVFINIHNLSYIFLQNWSLFRSFFYQTANDIMFKSEECWPHHVTNEFTKVVTVFNQFALIINRISVTIDSKRFSHANYGFLLAILSLIASTVFTAQQHFLGPIHGMRTTSCFRESDVVLDLKTEHIIPYLAICLTSIVCSLLLIIYVKKTQKTKTYDIESEYTKKEAVVSSISVAILGIIQLVLFCFYDTFLTIFAKLTAENPNVHDTNIIGWFYTSPLNAIISPTAVFLYISWIKKNRQMHIRKMTKVNKSENGCHFQQLSVMWNK